MIEAPEETRLDRRPNPHMAFGTGPHLCLGAFHARLIVRTLLEQLCEQVESITVVEAEPTAPNEANYQRSIGFDLLRVRIAAR